MEDSQNQQAATEEVKDQLENLEVSAEGAEEQEKKKKKKKKNKNKNNEGDVNVDENSPAPVTKEEQKEEGQPEDDGEEGEGEGAAKKKKKKKWKQKDKHHSSAVLLDKGNEGKSNKGTSTRKDKNHTKEIMNNDHDIDSCVFNNEVFEEGEYNKKKRSRSVLEPNKQSYRRIITNDRYEVLQEESTHQFSMVLKELNIADLNYFTTEAIRYFEEQKPDDRG